MCHTSPNCHSSWRRIFAGYRLQGVPSLYIRGEKTHPIHGTLDESPFQYAHTFPRTLCESVEWFLPTALPERTPPIQFFRFLSAPLY